MHGQINIHDVIFIYTENERPQPHDELACGLLITRTIALLKSATEPLIIFNELISIIALLKILSFLLTLSSNEKLYLKPEQPPPCTEILKYVLGLFLQNPVNFIFCCFCKFNFVIHIL